MLRRVEVCTSHFEKKTGKANEKASFDWLPRLNYFMYRSKTLSDLSTDTQLFIEKNHMALAQPGRIQ
jgi:hypothetical protein